MIARRLVCAVVIAGALAACGGLQPEDPSLALRQGAAAVGALKSVTATLKVTKGTITFQGFALVSASASVRVPDESDTVYLVRQQDFQIGLQVVILHGHVWLRPPLSKFQELTPAQAAQIPDLAKLFDPSVGLPAVIPSGRNPKYESADTVADVESHRVSATYTADQVHGMLPQLSSVGDVHAEIWIGGSDHLIRKAVLTGNFGDNGTFSTVEVDLSNFNGAVTIASPARTS
jgi:LppX/LprAFG-like lipoprotein